MPGWELPKPKTDKMKEAIMSESVKGTPGRKSSPEIRAHILSAVVGGAQTVRQLVASLKAAGLSATQPTVNNYVSRLVSENLVEELSAESTGAPGRPAARFVATDAGMKAANVEASDSVETETESAEESE